ASSAAAMARSSRSRSRSCFAFARWRARSSAASSSRASARAARSFADSVRSSRGMFTGDLAGASVTTRPHKITRLDGPQGGQPTSTNLSGPSAPIGRSIVVRQVLPTAPRLLYCVLGHVELVGDLLPGDWRVLRAQRLDPPDAVAGLVAGLPLLA